MGLGSCCHHFIVWQWQAGLRDRGQRNPCMAAGSLQLKIPMDPCLSTLMLNTAVPFLNFFPLFLNCCLSGLCLYRKTKKYHPNILKGTSDRSWNSYLLSGQAHPLYTDPSVSHGWTARRRNVQSHFQKVPTSVLTTNESSTASAPQGDRKKLVFWDVCTCITSTV